MKINKEIKESQDSNSELIKIYRNNIDISISNSSQIKPDENGNNKGDSKPPKINVISTFETDNFDINEYNLFQLSPKVLIFKILIKCM